MENKIIRLASWALSSFFLLILVLRLFELVGIDLHLRQLMYVSFLFGGFFCMRKIRIQWFDTIIIFYLFYLVINGITISYRHHWEFFYRALLVHLFPVMCYFIGRYTTVDISKYLERMKWPILFAMICGIVFYFVHPSWYVAMKQAQLSEYANDMRISEIYRLSSFWGHPYAVAYATLLYSLFLTKKLLLGIYQKKELYMHVSFLFVCLTVLMLAQLRVTIVMYVVCFFYMILFTKNESLGSRAKKIIISLFCVCLFSLIFLQFSSDSMEYIQAHMLNLTEEDSFSARFEHTAGDVNDFSFFGDGVGRYGYPARRYLLWAIVDNEFQCHMAETGYFGFALLITMLILTGVKCLKRKHLVLENSIFLFFCIAMVGASVLSNHHQYNYIFWYTVGLIWTKNYKPREIRG